MPALLTVVAPTGVEPENADLLNMPLSPSVTPLRSKPLPPTPAIPPTSDPNSATSTNAPPTTAVPPPTANAGPNIALDMFAIMQDFKSSLASFAVEVESIKRATTAAPPAPPSTSTPPTSAAVTAPTLSFPSAVQPTKPAPMTSAPTQPLEFAMARPRRPRQHASEPLRDSSAPQVASAGPDNSAHV